VVAIGRDMAGRLRDLGVDEARLRVIPNWADASAIRPLDGPSPLRAELGLGDAFVVMHSGNVGFSQGLETLLEAAAILRGEADVRFLIAGNGAAKPPLVRRAHEARLENVAFLDYQPKARLAESLGTADLHVIGLRAGLAGLIVPSKVYGVMAAARPFVAAVEPASEVALVAEEAGCGVRVDPGDAKLLAVRILELAADRAALTAMGRSGREEMERRYDRPIATNAYRELLEEVAGAGR
jgi:colanic acid biosynthesis glycosyl transferase WcaI